MDELRRWLKICQFQLVFNQLNSAKLVSCSFDVVNLLNLLKLLGLETMAVGRNNFIRT